MPFFFVSPSRFCISKMTRSYCIRLSIVAIVPLLSSLSTGHPLLKATQPIETRLLSAGLIEEMLLVIFLVLLGGVFAGMCLI